MAATTTLHTFYLSPALYTRELDLQRMQKEGTNYGEVLVYDRQINQITFGSSSTLLSRITEVMNRVDFSLYLCSLGGRKRRIFQRNLFSLARNQPASLAALKKYFTLFATLEQFDYDLGPIFDRQMHATCEDLARSTLADKDPRRETVSFIRNKAFFLESLSHQIESTELKVEVLKALSHLRVQDDHETRAVGLRALKALPWNMVKGRTFKSIFANMYSRSDLVRFETAGLLARFKEVENREYETKLVKIFKNESSPRVWKRILNILPCPKSLSVGSARTLHSILRNQKEGNWVREDILSYFEEAGGCTHRKDLEVIVEVLYQRNLAERVALACTRALRTLCLNTQAPLKATFLREGYNLQKITAKVERRDRINRT